MILIMIKGIPGDCQIAGFDESKFPGNACFAAESFGFGVTREFADSGKGGTEDVNMGVGELGEVSIDKSMDSASTMLARRAISGASCGTAEIFFVEPIDDGQKRFNVVYLHFKLDNCFIKSWTISSSGDDRPTESVTLWYNKIAFNYFPSTDGKTFAGCAAVEWDQVKSKKWDKAGVLQKNVPATKIAAD